MGPTAATPEAEVTAAIDVLEELRVPAGSTVEGAIRLKEDVDSALDHLRRARSLLRGEVSQPDNQGAAPLA